MALLWRSLRNVGQALTQSVKLISPSSYTCNTICRHASDDSSKHNDRSPVYNAYPEFETPSPYRNKFMRRYGYEYKYHTGGLLPRSEKYQFDPLPMPKFDPEHPFTTKKALFGQNDYIDILGDGTIHPSQLIQGPKFLKGFRGNEMQRLVRRLAFQGDYLKEYFPTEYHKIRKRITYLYKKLNHRRSHGNYWSRHGNFRYSRTVYKY